MANDLAIKRRIKSVKSIRQVTKTMQIVAASRMKKVQESAEKLAPYSKVLLKILDRVSNDKDLISNNPYFKQKEGNKTLMIVVSPTRGLAGALPSNLVNATIKWVKSHSEKQTSFICINKKAFRTLKKVKYDILSFFDDMNNKTEVSDLGPVLEEIKKAFIDGEYSSVYLTYSKFVNVVTQKPVIEKLLPIDPESVNKNLEDEEEDFLIEPSMIDVLNDIIPHYLEMRIFDAIINNSASEESARMVAMKNATDNAKDMIDALILSFNKSRQMKITQQVAEISAAL